MWNGRSSRTSFDLTDIFITLGIPSNLAPGCEPNPPRLLGRERFGKACINVCSNCIAVLGRRHRKWRSRNHACMHAGGVCVWSLFVCRHFCFLCFFHFLCFYPKPLALGAQAPLCNFCYSGIRAWRVRLSIEENTTLLWSIVLASPRAQTSRREWFWVEQKTNQNARALIFMISNNNLIQSMSLAKLHAK